MSLKDEMIIVVDEDEILEVEERIEIFKSLEFPVYEDDNDKTQ